MKPFITSFRGHTILFVLATLILNIKVLYSQEVLAPDQNPNYRKSQDKYMTMKDTLTKNQGTTVHATYKAIDDMQIKQERKDLRKSNRQERRLARINNRGYYGGYNNCNSNFGYYNPSMYPYNYQYQNMYSPYSYYSPSCVFNSIDRIALWGLGAYLLLR